MLSAKFLPLVAIAGAALTAAAPAALKKRSDIDTTILQYALTLEHLEDTFYHSLLDKLSVQDFEDQGFGPWIRNRYLEIGGQERQHVEFLTNAIGQDAVKACTYDFGVTDVQSFIAASQLIEGVGVSAYLGAAHLITNPAYVTAAGSILTTEARHSSWIQSSAALSDPAGAAYDVPTTFNETYSLVAPFIKSCPSSNAKLPVAAFPTLNLTPSSGIKPGDQLKVSGNGVKDGQYLACITSGGTYFAQIQNMMATVPQNVTTGRTYYLVTSGNNNVTDDNTIAGPVAIDYLLSASAAASLVSSQYN